MTKMSNPFHLPSPSPWPTLSSMMMLSVTIMILSFIGSNSIKMNKILMMMMMIAYVASLWWKDIKRESSMKGNHSIVTMKLMKHSMIMFIISEVMFFVSFFWAFFHSSISPNVELGMKWPPNSIKAFDPMATPLLNSMILLSSGATVTWSHHEFLMKKTNPSIKSMMVTVMLGITFTGFQGMEYFMAQFSFSDSIYASTFFLATGFHGIHVIIGTLFLITSMKSMQSLMNSSHHFISLDLSIWYWHFVDIVWLFLFSMIYWWGSM